MAETPPPRRRAVALRYDQSRDSAPKIIAKGQGYVAERILTIAREQGIHIQEDPDLVTVLAALDVEAEIPADLYRAVAEVLAFVYRLNNRMA